MIEISEETLIADISSLLMNALPEILINIEEQSDDAVKLPPFRYAGTRENLPTGTGYPYVILDIEESTYTTKDRIIKNVVYSLQLTIKLADTSTIWRYNAAIKTVIKNSEKNYRIDTEKTSKDGIIILQVKTQ